MKSLWHMFVGKTFLAAPPLPDWESPLWTFSPGIAVSTVLSARCTPAISLNFQVTFALGRVHRLRPALG